MLDFKQQDPEKNKGYRAALLVVDIFSRFAYAEPLETKTSEEVAAAFERILKRVKTNRVTGKRSSARPTEVSTDSGNEFKGAFSELLNRLNIVQTGKTSRNALAVADATTNHDQRHHEEGADRHRLRVLGGGPPESHRGLQLKQPQRHPGRCAERGAEVQKSFSTSSRSKLAMMPSRTRPSTKIGF